MILFDLKIYLIKIKLGRNPPGISMQAIPLDWMY